MKNHGCAVFAETSSFYFLQFRTCSQDVSRHPECSQCADHRSSPQTGHELREIGENDRYRPSDPAEEKKNRSSNSHLASRRPLVAACRTQKGLEKEQAWFSPDATDQPQQQEEPEHRSQTSQASKHPVDRQGHDQDAAAPPPVSQVSPDVATHHHSFKKQQENCHYCQVFWTLLITKTS